VSDPSDTGVKLDPRDPFRGSPNPFRFTEAQRRALSTTTMLQKPPSAEARDQFLQLLERRKTIEGIPTDVLFTLEAVRQLAEQGNMVAEQLYWSERVRLGIDVPKTFHMPGGK
jgi:hypothetical protein